jgi:hypothetical protein
MPLAARSCAAPIRVECAARCVGSLGVKHRSDPPNDPGDFLRSHRGLTDAARIGKPAKDRSIFDVRRGHPRSQLCDRLPG